MHHVIIWAWLNQMVCRKPPVIQNRTRIYPIRNHVENTRKCFGLGIHSNTSNVLSLINHVVLVNLLAQTDSQLLNPQI